MYKMHYTFQFGDFLTLARARRKFGAFRGYRRYVPLMLIYLATFFYWTADSSPSYFDAVALGVAAGGAVALFVLLNLVDWIIESTLYRLHFRRFALANRKLDVHIDDSGISWSSDGLSGRTAWSAVQRAIDMKSALVLFISNIEGLVLPDRGYAPEEMQSARRFVLAHSASAVASPQDHAS